MTGAERHRAPHPRGWPWAPAPSCWPLRSGSSAPAGLAGVAVFYGLYRIVLVAVGSRLQDAIEGPARATVSSVAALLSELAAIAIYGLWAVDGLAPITALIMLLAVVLPWALRRRSGLSRRATG